MNTNTEAGILAASTEAIKTLVTTKMHKGQAFSIKTIDSWTQAERIIKGDRARVIALRAALAELANEGVIVRKDRAYAPNVREGYQLV